MVLDIQGQIYYLKPLAQIALGPRLYFSRLLVAKVMKGGQSLWLLPPARHTQNEFHIVVSGGSVNWSRTVG